MTRDEILIAMKEVGAAMFDLMPKTYEGVVDVFERFAALVAAAERNKCAKFLELIDLSCIAEHDSCQRLMAGLLKNCAESIRAVNNVQQEPQSKD